MRLNRENVKGKVKGYEYNYYGRIKKESDRKIRK